MIAGSKESSAGIVVVRAIDVKVQALETPTEWQELGLCARLKKSTVMAVQNFLRSYSLQLHAAPSPPLHIRTTFGRDDPIDCSLRILENDFEISLT
jgi:hypothetical protein